MRKPRLLCMSVISGAPEAVRIINGIAEVEYHQPGDRGWLLSHIEDYDLLWVHVDTKVTADMLARAQKLRAIATSSTGTDHIDREAAAERGIRILSNTRDYGLLDRFTATAEMAWLLLMACCRNLRSAVGFVMDGNWQVDPTRFSGVQLTEMTLGVLGVGRLGRMTCRFAQGFCPRVLGCDLKGVELPGVEEVDFETLLRESDAISIHIHMLPRNHHLFNRDVFARMKDGAYLVNTSRGDIIDEAALLSALESGKLAGFGADVLHDEWRADMGESPVVRYAQTHDNVVLTPHIAGATDTSIWEARAFTARKIAHYLETGEELRMA